jgi:murein DD-endopeptidase MepM/ murein hydrolase activator NlpD
VIRAAALALGAASVAQIGGAPAQTGATFRLAGALTQGGVATGVAPPGTVRLTLDGDAVPLAADGGFLIAFDRDALPTVTLTAERRDAPPLTERLSIAPRAWRIERLDRLARLPAPSEAFLRLRAPELAQIDAARRVVTSAGGWRGSFRWPAIGRVSGLFGAQRIYRGEPGAYHSGVDVARPSGAPVVAPADGVVVLAASEPFTLEGRLLIVDHGMGMNSAFLHLSRIDVRVGQAVCQGEPMGAVGATGRATGPHLHWGMTWRGRRIDPLLLAGTMPTVSP